MRLSYLHPVAVYRVDRCEHWPARDFHRTAFPKAKLWMEHLYSDESQLTWLKGYCHPIRFGNLVQTRKVPAELLEQLPQINEAADEPVFPTVEEQERAKEIIIKGWDDIVGVKIRCAPPAGSRPPTSLNDLPRRPSVLG
jgi:putative spermidine/putrescine transport system substrate-binding protein